MSSPSHRFRCKADNSSGVRPKVERSRNLGMVRNRLRAILLHVPYYSTDGAARLAADIFVHRSTISRLMNGRRVPSPAVARRIAKVVSERMLWDIPEWEIFSDTGRFPTSSVCDLVGDCFGCLPPEAWDERANRLKEEWQHAYPGDWCRYEAVRPNAAQ